MGAMKWLLTCALLVWALPAQGGVAWKSRTKRFAASNPLPRVSCGMVYDEARDRVVLFGGHSALPGIALLGDTWEWDGNDWTWRTPVTSPPNRAPGHGMAYDAARQRVVLYGSSGAGDTWEWDGTNWTQRFPATSPGPRYLPAMAYDRARQRVVLYGGWLPNSRTILLDTWEWDGTNWTQREARGGPGGSLPAMTFDPVRQRVVSFQLFDTYEWDGTTWSRILSNNPVRGGRRKHGMTTDFLRGRVVLYGGLSVSGVVAETWEWDGADWMERTPAENPGTRSWFGMAYHGTRGRVVLFGGVGDGAMRDDTWEYRPVRPAWYAPFGSGCPGSSGVPTVAAAPLNLPWIDDTFRVEVGNVAAGSGVFLVAGLSNTTWQGQPLPRSLAPFGLPAACNALVSVDAVAFSFATGTTASFGVPICNCPTLIGTTFHHQALVLDPAGPVVSNAATGVVGGR